MQLAFITHAHSDHLHPGSGKYFCAEPTAPLIAKRLGDGTSVEAVPYGKTLSQKHAQVSFHPAGHILGSAQIRVETGGQTWGMTGDYKRDPDPTCAPFEPVTCDVFITEATFAYPFYRWERSAFIDILSWWESNRKLGKTSVLFCYALGKAQRVLAELGALTQQPIFTHGAVESLTTIYRKQGVHLPATVPVSSVDPNDSLAGALVLAPPSAHRSPWMRRFKYVSTGFASGWMRVRGNRRRRGYDRGFVVSDHADWPSLLKTIDESGARRVLVTHGASDVLVRYLKEKGLNAEALQTAFEGETET